jgi:hypothetical protein
MSLYTARTIGGGTDAIGTTLPTFRLGLTGPTFYNGSADPSISPPTPMDDGFSDGDVYIRSITGGSALWIYDSAVWTQIASGAGGGSFAGDIIMQPGAQLLGDETAVAAEPAFAFDGDIGTGIFQPGIGLIGFSLAGVEHMRFSSADVRFGASVRADVSTAVAPTFSFLTDDDTGMFSPVANTIGFSTGGIQALVIEADGTLASTITSYETLVLADNDIPNRKYVEDNFVNAAGDSMTGSLIMSNSTQIVGGSGTIGAPSIAFVGDLDTGVLYDAIGEFALVSEGAETIRFNGTTADGSLLWRGGDGVVATPAISFSNDPNTGFYSSAVDTISFSAGGVLAANMDIGGIEVLNGTNAAPSYSFINDTDTGMYLSGIGFLEFTVGGIDQLQINATDIRALPPYRGASGTSGAPGFSFNTDSDTGMYRSAANTLAFATTGAERLNISSAGVLKVAETMRLTERATRLETPAATFGELWVRSDTPNVLIYTDDAGTDHNIVPSIGVYKSYSAAAFDSGAHYVGGFYNFSATAATLTIGGTVTQTFGAATQSNAAHAFIVASGAGGVDLVLTVTGISINDAGGRNPADSEIIVADTDTATTNQYFETTKKWLGQITYTLTGAAGSFVFNYGLVKYDDFGNRNFVVTDFEVTGLAAANEAGLDIELLHHESTAFVYSAGAFVPNATPLISLVGDHATDNQVDTADNFAYKRAGLALAIAGASNEGIIIRVTTSTNNSMAYMNFHVGATS